MSRKSLGVLFAGLIIGFGSGSARADGPPPAAYTSDFALGAAVGGIALGISAPKAFIAGQPMQVFVGEFNVSDAPLRVGFYLAQPMVLVFDSSGNLVPENHRKGATFLRALSVFQGDATETIPPHFGFEDHWDLYDVYQLKAGHYTAVYERKGADIAGFNGANDSLTRTLKGLMLSSAVVAFDVR